MAGWNLENSCKVVPKHLPETARMGPVPHDVCYYVLIANPI